MKRILLLVITLLLVISCSTTKLLPEGKYRLASNKVEFAGKEKLPGAEVNQYIRQQPNTYILFGWNPFLYVYNWSNGSGQGINKFWEKVGVAPVVFDPALMESSRTNIADHLQTLGYYGSRVDADVTYDKRLARVKYRIEPGHRFRIDSLVFDVPGGEFGEEFRADSANITVHQGDFLSEKALEAETVRGAAVMRDRGYYAFNKNNYFFEADTLSPRTTLYYRIKGYTRNENASNDSPIRKYRIGDVRISHPAEIPFRESLLRKFNTIQPGALYSERMVNTTYSRLSALKVFNDVSIEMTPSDSATVDCDIRLGGTDLLGFKANVEASTNASGLLGFSPQLSFYHKNLFHGGEWLNLGFSGNFQYLPSSGAHSNEFGISASLSFPRLLGYPMERIHGVNIPRTDLSASFNYQNRPEYRRTMATLNYGYSGQFGRRLFYQFNPLQVNLAKLYDINDDFMIRMLDYPYLWDTFEDHIDAGVGLMLYYTTNADVVPKTAYHYERLNLDFSGNLISLLNSVLPLYEAPGGTSYHLLFGLPYKQYVRAELNLGRVFRFGWNDNQALAMRLVAGAGWAYGNSYALSFERQFYCGGASSMRGWQARTLGPGYQELSEFFVLPSQTGNLKLEADLEYRFPMFWKLEGALFAETGNVWEMGSDDPETAVDLPGSLAADWGLGLRVNLNFILLRLDAGFRIHDPARTAGSRWVGPKGWFTEGATALHFGVGYPF
ncbi:MAG: BamA/TamA family outer membrane protein [Bacteroidales bacterium]|nr:BamA/TamA family outer membrane protein [Bacteroidales bacterium]